MFLIYLAIGTLAGLVSGLFGIGGGVIVVPTLAAALTYENMIPKDAIMQMTIGTSLATMILTTLSGWYAYYKLDAIRGDIIKRILPNLLIGILIGAVIADFLPSIYLKSIFGLFLIILSTRMLFFSINSINAKPLAKQTVTIIATCIGMLSSILGIGGGTMLVPFFLRLNANMPQALGTSLACGILISFSASLCFMLTGSLTSTHIAWSTGYIYWPAFLGIIITSILFAPIGTALACKLPAPLLKHLFAVFLFLIGIDMLIFMR